MQEKNRRRLMLILIAVAALAVVALVVVFAVIRPLNAQSEKMQAALEEIAAATPKPTVAPTPTPAPTPEPPWTRQIIRTYSAGSAEPFQLEEYDPDGNRLVMETERDGRKEYEYDEAGHVVKCTEYSVWDHTVADRWTEYRYNADGKETERWVYVKSSGGEPYLDDYFVTTYDERGNKLRLEKSDKNSGLYEWEDVTYTYDDAGRILKSVLVNTHVSDGSYTETEINVYDAAGNLVDYREQTVSRNEFVSSYNTRCTNEYNELNQLIKETDYWNGRLEGYTAHEYDEKGFRVKSTAYENNEPVRYTVYERDEAGELRKSSNYSAGGTLRSFTLYDAEGRLLGEDVTVEYDGAGRPVKIAEVSDDGEPGEWATLAYDEQGRLLRKEYYRMDDGAEELKRYDAYEYVY